MVARSFEVFWVHRAQHLVCGDAFVEALGERLEKRHPPEPFVHGRCGHRAADASAALGGTFACRGARC